MTHPEGRGWRLGLTGGIGCGKSTVAACFAKAGWSVLSADMRVREILATNKVVKEALRTRWGASVFDKQDHVNRDAVADRVFKDSNELEWLEELLHPLVKDDWTRAMQEKPRLNWLIEIPLLFEKRLEKEFDFSVCVTCPKAIVIARLTLKGFSKVAIEQRFTAGWLCLRRRKNVLTLS